jgi:hypothetical protein
LFLDALFGDFGRPPTLECGSKVPLRVVEPSQSASHLGRRSGLLAQRDRYW